MATNQWIAGLRARLALVEAANYVLCRLDEHVTHGPDGTPRPCGCDLCEALRQVLERLEKGEITSG